MWRIFFEFKNSFTIVSNFGQKTQRLTFLQILPFVPQRRQTAQNVSAKLITKLVISCDLFFPVTRFSIFYNVNFFPVTPLLVTRYCVTRFSNTPTNLLSQAITARAHCLFTQQKPLDSLMTQLTDQVYCISCNLFNIGIICSNDISISIGTDYGVSYIMVWLTGIYSSRPANSLELRIWRWTTKTVEYL